MVHISQINSQTLVSSANFYTHDLLESYSTVQDGPRRVATNPMLNHLEHLGVVALLVSRYNLHGSELVLLVGVGFFFGGGDRLSEYMREELTSGIIHPWAPTDVVEHVQSNVQGVPYTDGEKRKLCFSKIWVCLPCCPGSFIPDAKERRRCVTPDERMERWKR